MKAMTNVARFPIRADFFLPALVALLITLLLFYVDEGRYSFDGISRPENLFFFMIFASVFFFFQLGVQILLEQFLRPGKLRRMISIALSAISLPLALFAFFLIIKAI
jgi:succinate dehydrogenase hydrophobic anchor subunit